jgi:hypothetical protein
VAGPWFSLCSPFYSTNKKGRGCESKKIFFVWRKLKIETKMRKGKYVSKIKPVII